MIVPIKQRAIITFVFKRINIHRRSLNVYGRLHLISTKKIQINNINGKLREKGETHFNDRPHSDKIAAAMNENVLITELLLQKKL